MGAIVLLLGIIFGIALGNQIAAIVYGTVLTVAPPILPLWTLGLALILSPLSFVVLLKAERRDAGWILLVGILAFVSARTGQRVLGPELGAFAGAFVSGLASAWYARITNRPAQITLVPGLLLLVPGSVGLQSLSSLLDRQIDLGIEGAFRMVLIAVSLVAGTLMANIVSPRRKLMTS
jgi:uncharacterized membrane protein YjjB (DUF3815 family)